MPPWPGQAPKRVIIAEDEVEMTPELVGLIMADYEPARRLLEDSKEYEADAKDRIRELLADAGGAKGVLPDGRRVTIAHRQNADSTVVAWELVAKAYRKALEGLVDLTFTGQKLAPSAADLDAIESMFTTTKPGARPLRITIGKDTK